MSKIPRVCKKGWYAKVDQNMLSCILRCLGNNVQSWPNIPSGVPKNWFLAVLFTIQLLCQNVDNKVARDYVESPLEIYRCDTCRGKIQLKKNPKYLQVCQKTGLLFGWVCQKVVNRCSGLQPKTVVVHRNVNNNKDTSHDLKPNLSCAIFWHP